MRRWFVLLAVLIVGGVGGAAAMIGSLEINRITAEDSFCTSCHSMTHIAADPVFVRSAHRANEKGVRAGCADCHIPTTNWFVETYVHVSSGLRDVIAETTHDYADPALWEARRRVLAHEVREDMRRSDSVTCRGCHDAAAIRPASQAGRAAHALLATGQMTCIDCHINLVHAPVAPEPSFLSGSGLDRAGAALRDAGKGSPP